MLLDDNINISHCPIYDVSHVTLIIKYDLYIYIYIYVYIFYMNVYKFITLNEINTML